VSGAQGEIEGEILSKAKESASPEVLILNYQITNLPNYQILGLVKLPAPQREKTLAR